MQSAGDIFLGWTQGINERAVYVRQLRDMKMSAIADGIAINCGPTRDRMLGPRQERMLAQVMQQ